MELRHLAYFVAVAEELNFTRAAGRLHVVQSGVSAAIRALEHELGAELFDRDSKRVTLTDAGIALLPEAQATLAAAQAARDAVGEVAGGLRGTVSVGTMTVTGILDMPALFGRFHAEHPAVTIRLSAATSGSAGLVEAVLDGRLDMAFVALPGRPPATLAVRELASAPFAAVVPAGHRLAGEREVTLAALADEPFIDSPPGYGNRAIVDRELAAEGLRRHVVMEVADITTVPAYVRHGLGVAVLPSFALPAGDPLTRVIPLAGPPVAWTLSVATHACRRRNAALRALLAIAGEFVAGEERPPSLGPD
ncbi:LysR family transcriptional regulator [Sphaerisporangium melleum]|uniref:LysR family transcriptional regulator n=1 Tax=Sphaerisporangium melleum TaxID=321316 RepID=A0A917RJX2_9ACTN|nr:LysR family transcriptional regulator [Sphaerisporangium melleum]GGL11318.1 LysR family transcriptional regulator [Sphaerisporangium melleum]GII71742.1 LysR family transcriptional regulator [Sphaerisporangium melleum]